METFLEFAGYAGAAFVGTGAAFIALRFLSETIFGHWLAKGLAKYTAAIETQEHGKRVVAERLYDQRLSFVAGLSERLVKLESLLSKEIRMPLELPDAGPELFYLQRCRQVNDAVNEMLESVTECSYLFEKGEVLIALAFRHGNRLRKLSDGITEGITTHLAGEEYWTLPMVSRHKCVSNVRSTVLTGETDYSIDELMQRIRQIRAGTL